MTMVKPQDVVILLKLVVAGEGWTCPSLGESLGMGAAAVHSGVVRARRAGLYAEDRRAPIRRALTEFLVHGLRYVFPAEDGAMTRGFPTAHAALPLCEQVVPDGEPPPVWPDADGTVHGKALRPLHPCVPGAARKDAALYELLALVDAVRGRRPGERRLAVSELRARLKRR